MSDDEVVYFCLCAFPFVFTAVVILLYVAFNQMKNDK